MTTVAIVYHSGYGHTALQAEAVKEGAESVEGTEVIFLTAEEAEADLQKLKPADAIVFGTPTYMGSPSAPFKSFMDKSSKAWFGLEWKDKIAGGFTSSSSPSGDKVQALQALVVLAAQHGMIWVGYAGLPETADPDYDGPEEEALNRLGGFLGAMALTKDAEPGPQNPPKGDIDTAKRYGARIAAAAKRWRSGSAG